MSPLESITVSLRRFSKYLVVSAFPFSVNAQDFNAKLILGINGAQVDGDRISGYNKVGLNLGGGVSYKVGKKTDLQIEISYSQKGARSTEKDSIYLVYRINYIDIPLLVMFKPSENSPVVYGGISYNRLINAKLDDGFGFFDVPSFYKSESSIIGGLEYEVTPGLSFNFRFSYSIFAAHPLGLWNNFLSLTARINLSSNKMD